MNSWLLGIRQSIARTLIPSPPSGNGGRIATRNEMHFIKWVGVTVLSSVMGVVLGGLAQVAMPDMSMLVRVLLELVGTGLILRALVELARIASTIEIHHGKQFD
jgi:hypothetical protein